MVILQDLRSLSFRLDRIGLVRFPSSDMLSAMKAEAGDYQTASFLPSGADFRVITLANGFPPREKGAAGALPCGALWCFAQPLRLARRAFRRSATFRPTAPRGGATSISPSGSLRHLAAPRSSSGAPNPRLLNPHRLHVDLPRNRFDRQSFTCDVVKLEYTYPQQVHRRNALTRTVGTNPSSESRRMLRAGGGRPERHLRAVRLERFGTQRTTFACSRGK